MFEARQRRFPEHYNSEEAQEQFLDAVYARRLFDDLRWLSPKEVSDSVKEILHQRGERLALRINDGPIPTDLGDWTLVGVGDKTDGHIHEALVLGDIHNGAVEGSERLPVYICQSNHFGETYYERDNGESKIRLHAAMDTIREHGKGVVVYLHQEAKGNGVIGELERLNQKYHWVDGQIVEKDDDLQRAFGAHMSEHYDGEVVAQMLEEMGVDVNAVEFVEGSLNSLEASEKLHSLNGEIVAEHSAAIEMAADTFKYSWFEPFHAQDVIKASLMGQGRSLTRELGRAPLPTEYGDWTVVAIGDKTDGSVHHVLVYGDAEDEVQHGENILVRLHSACHTSETYHAINCECREELQQTMQMIQQEGAGVIVYLQQEGRGNGVVGKLDQLQGMFGWNEEGKIEQKTDPNTGERVNTVQAYIEAGYVSERRDFTAAGQILQNLGITSARLVSNNPRKMQGVEAAGIAVSPVSILIRPPNAIVAADLEHKAKGDGHNIPPEYWKVIPAEPVTEPKEGEGHDVQ